MKELNHAVRRRGLFASVKKYIFWQKSTQTIQKNRQKTKAAVGHEAADHWILYPSTIGPARLNHLRKVIAYTTHLEVCRKAFCY